MIIKSKLTEQDIINANFVLIYSKTSSRIFTGVIALFFLISVLTAIFSTKGFLLPTMLSVVMLLAVPLKTYYGAKRSFRANKRSRETIEYYFENNSLAIKGESFNSESSLEKLYKVTVTKNWLFLWQNNQIAHPIPRRDISKEQIDYLKEILQNNKVKNNL